MNKRYYFELKEKPIVTLNINGKIADNVLSKIDEIISKLKLIPIGSFDDEWQPLFRATEYYSSVDEIEEFYNENRAILKIVDEYGVEYTWEELNNNLIDKNKDLAGRGEYNDNKGYCFMRFS